MRGGGYELSFTLMNPADTFLIENEKLKTLNFKYNVNGGLYWENWMDTYKGYVKGIKLKDNAWQVEIDVWINMKDQQLNKEHKKQITINDKFIL
jgi:hypothetical protein